MWLHFLQRNLCNLMNFHHYCNYPLVSIDVLFVLFITYTIIFIESSIIAQGRIATPTFLLKIPFCNLSNTCHIDFWISFPHQATTPIPTSNLLPCSYSDDDGDFKGEITTNGTMLCNSPLACHSNSSRLFWCLATTFSSYLFQDFILSRSTTFYVSSSLTMKLCNLLNMFSSRMLQHTL
jgi:hypothetical protein